jgi:hypothetical protein
MPRENQMCNVNIYLMGDSQGKIEEIVSLTRYQVTFGMNEQSMNESLVVSDQYSL